MKKSEYYLRILASIILFIVGAYILINVYFIFSVKDGNMYDGFGSVYINGRPKSIYTIIGIICSISGINLFIKTNEKKRKQEDKEL